MRATQKQLDTAAHQLSLATDSDKYKALLTVAVLAINEREDKLAMITEDLHRAIQAYNELMEAKA